MALVIGKKDKVSRKLSKAERFAAWLVPQSALMRSRSLEKNEQELMRIEDRVKQAKTPNRFIINTSPTATTIRETSASTRDREGLGTFLLQEAGQSALRPKAKAPFKNKRS